MGYLATLLTVVVVATAAIRLSEAQPSCASNLVPCFSYLNATTRPPASCCDPMRQAVTNDLACLCNLYRNPSFLSGLGINVTQALHLPTLCGIPGDTSACGIATAPTSSHGSPPGTPGTPGNDGTKTASAGIFSFFVLVATSIMLY